jgi:hypothetical protein
VNEQATFSVWDALSDFGFTPDSKVMISEVQPGLTYDFGNFKLSASALTSMHLRKVVSLWGDMATPGKLAHINFELPAMVDSREQLTAFLAYILDKAAGGDGFCPLHPVEWLSDGRTHRMLLPWEVERKVREAERRKFDARPKCSVPRVWLRLTLNSLEELLDQVEDWEKVEFGFNGTILAIRCRGKVLPAPAEGYLWPIDFTIQAGNLRLLPKRLMYDQVEVSVYEEKLLIGNRHFQGAMEKMP